MVLTPMRVLVLLLIGLHLFAAPTDDFDARVLKFHRRWDRFVRTYWGCDKDAPNRTDCQSWKGGLDRKAFAEAREAAKPLFDLK
ncbi:MAG: hypothetical protein KGL39_33080 [Patescibacteria group bacterium]|nr:hypothetical protein [Patescibacteria group bacterium]